MQNDDIDELGQLNVQIGEDESKGDYNWLDGVIAPKLAFRRLRGRCRILRVTENIATFPASPMRSTRHRKTASVRGVKGVRLA